MDIGSQLPHAALRVFVMGERGAEREPATPADIQAMSALAKAAMEAGSLGFSTSRTLNHRTSDGKPTPTLTAGEDELMGIAMGLSAAGRGVLQVVSDFVDPLAEFAMLRRLVEASGRPLSFSLVQSPRAPRGYQHLLNELAAASAAGLSMRAQVAGRPVGVLFGLELTLNPFSHHPSYLAIKDRPLSERVAALRDPGFRARLLAEDSSATQGFAALQPRNWEKMFILGEEPDYEQDETRTVEALAVRAGVEPAHLALDHMLSDGGRGMLYLAVPQLRGRLVGPRLRDAHPSQHRAGAISDGGAHVGMICDGSFPTSNLTHWTRGPASRLQDRP